MLLSTIADLKLYLGRAINSATELKFIEPYIELAEERFILRAIGPELLAELDEQCKNKSELTEANQKLLKKLQRALAFYTYVKYLPYSLGNDGDNGLQEQGTEKTQPVRMGVLDKRLRESAVNAAEALESALVYLQLHKADYPTWTNSEAYKRANALFVYSGSDLTSYLPQANGSYRLFLSLVPYIAKVEKEQILPLIGQALFDDLKVKRLALTPPAPVDFRILEAVGKATATAAYALAFPHLNAVTSADGSLRILSDFDGIYNQKNVDKEQLAQFRGEADLDAQMSLNSLKLYLEQFADQYPLYKTSDRYQAAGPNKLPDNTAYIGIFRMR